MDDADRLRFLQGGLQHGTLADCFCEIVSGYFGADHEKYVRDTFEIALELAIDAAVSAERERFRVRLACIATVSSCHDLHVESCAADDCMICCTTDLIAEFSSIRALPQVPDDA